MLLRDTIFVTDVHMADAAHGMLGGTHDGS